jgi:hypothetical protein
MMKPGKYYVGDLCYVFNDEDWDQVCGVIIDGHSCLEGEFNLPDGRRFAIFNTAWGDGEYFDQNGHSYSVDAGCIGCTLVDNISSDRYKDLTELGSVVEFEESFTVYKKNGKIHIGHIVVDTDPDHEEEEDEEDEDYDYEDY